MSYINRRVMFYQLKVLRNDNNEKIPMNKVYELFDKIVSRFQTGKEEGYNIFSKVLIPGEENQVTIDIIKYDKKIAFCRMGRTKDINSMHKRNLKDLSTNKIDVNAEEAIEIFSYFLLDFKYGIITHMFGRSAPKLKSFEFLFKDAVIKAEKNIKLRAEIEPIPNDDAIGMINGINHFYAMEAKFEMPASEFFEKHGVKLGKKDYLKFSEIESKNITIIISGGDEDIKKDKYKGLQESITELYGYRNSELKKLTVKATIDNKDKSETINLLEEYFTREIYLQQEVRTTYIPVGNIESQLMYVFNDMLNDLVTRIK